MFFVAASRHQKSRCGQWKCTPRALGLVRLGSSLLGFNAITGKRRQVHPTHHPGVPTWFLRDLCVCVSWIASILSLWPFRLTNTSCNSRSRQKLRRFVIEHPCSLLISWCCCPSPLDPATTTNSYLPTVLVSAGQQQLPPAASLATDISPSFRLFPRDKYSPRWRRRSSRLNDWGRNSRKYDDGPPSDSPLTLELADH